MNLCARCDFHGDLAKHAPESGHWLCPGCFQSLREDDPIQGCERCLTDFRRLLATAVLLWQELPHHLRTVSGSGLDGSVSGSGDSALPGGAALALLGPGGTGATARRLTRTDLERGVDGREHGVDNHATDTPSVAWTLGQLEDDWRHTRGDTAAMTGTSTSAIIRGAIRYLDTHARWAANTHPAFADCLTELRQLVTTLEQATHRTRRPVRAAADCFDCSGPLYRRVIDGLEEDTLTCRQCKASYDPRRYALSLAEHAWHASRVEVDGEIWTTVERAAHDSSRPISTIRVWIHRQKIRTLTMKGVVLVAEADVQARVSA